MRSGNARESLALVALPREVHGVGLHCQPEISLPQGLICQGLPPNVIAVNPLVDFLEYVVPFFKVNTLQKRGQESSLVELIVIHRVMSGFQSQQPDFSFIFREHAVFEVLYYRSHLAFFACCTIDGLGLLYCLDTWGV